MTPATICELYSKLQAICTDCSKFECNKERLIAIPVMPRLRICQNHCTNVGLRCISMFVDFKVVPSMVGGTMKWLSERAPLTSTSYI